MEPLNIIRGVQVRDSEIGGVICVDYGVWGARGDPFEIWGVGVRLEPAETLHMGYGMA